MSTGNTRLTNTTATATFIDRGSAGEPVPRASTEGQLTNPPHTQQTDSPELHALIGREPVPLPAINLLASVPPGGLKAGDLALNSELQAGVRRARASAVRGPAASTQDKYKDTDLGTALELANFDLQGTIPLLSPEMRGEEENDPLSRQRVLNRTHQWLDGELERSFPGGVRFMPRAGRNTAEDADAKFALLHLPNEIETHADHVVKVHGRDQLWTVEVDSKQRVTVQRHGPGTAEVPPTSRFTTRSEAQAALERDFGVRVTDSATRTWNERELSNAHAAFSTMSPSERAALQGVRLERVEKIEGDRPAKFSWNLRTGGNPRLVVADKAFGTDDKRFIGDGSRPNGRLPHSVFTMLHESGHAIESQEQRAALRALSGATTDDELAKADADLRKVVVDRGTPQERTARLSRFAAFVEENKIPAITDYAYDQGVEELYCESFAAFRSDPSYLQKNSPLIYKYFAENRHF